MIQATINPVTLIVETICKAITSCGIRPVGLAIQAIVDAITLVIETVLDTVAAIIETVLDAVTGIRECRAADNEQCDTYCDGLSDIHVCSPLYPYKVRLSVRITEQMESG
jgi:hypothetical protein